MSEIANIIGMLGKLAPIISAGTAGAGIISEIQLQQKEKAALDRAMYYSKHPEAVTNMVKGATQPLSTGLTAGVGNEVNASLAEQGLSQAPGIQSQVLAQALAPYYQNEQKMALEQVLGTIGMPLQALTAMQGMQNPMTLAMLMQSILPKGSAQFNTTGTMNPMDMGPGGPFDTGITAGTPPIFDTGATGTDVPIFGVPGQP